MRIVLLRHGQTPSNVSHALDTLVPGPGLTDLGRRQAAAVPAVLAGSGLAGRGLAVDAVWASTATRAQQTAQPLAESLGLDVGVLDGLREIEAGELEMRTDEDAVRRYVENTVAWGRGDLAARLPGAQDGVAVMARFDAAIEQVVAGGASTAVVVSHGAVIRLWTALRVLGVDIGSMAQRWMENTGAVMMEAVGSADGDPERPWRLLDWHGQPLGGAEMAPDRDEEGPMAPPLTQASAGSALEQ